MDTEIYTFEDLLERDGQIFYRTSGNSMRPLIKTGRDLVIISRKNGRLKKYDVGFYRSGGKYILHRVLSVCDGHYITAGDNNNFKEKVAEADMLGVMTGIKRSGKDVPLGTLYRLYVRLWGGNYALRRVIQRPYRKLRSAAGRLYRKIRGK